MKELVAKVHKAIDTGPFGCTEEQARAAIKATLEHLSENASASVLSADPGTSTCDNVAWSRAKLKAMCSQALKEMEG